MAGAEQAVVDESTSIVMEDSLSLAERGEMTGTAKRYQSRVEADQRHKVVEFRVCINIYEARKLQGTRNNPTLRVACKCGQQVKKTKSKKGSLSPKFDEVMIFTFSCTREDMLDRPLEIKVLNTGQILLQDSLVGSYRMNLGVVYAQIDHCYEKKWLLLSDPQNFVGEMKGYLKISIQVIGPGDNPKNFPLSLEKSDENIESNLLQPAGVSLVSGILTIKLYRGEDFPQMDPGYIDKFKKVPKDLADPYCKVSFAGHEVQTPVVKHNYDPEWNSMMKLSVLFPTMSERIKFQVMDQDEILNVSRISQDDHIGTVYLNISHISEAGESGFPPTFGPSFINIYGSPREFEGIKFSDDYINFNKGLMDGVAYKGRILVEVNSDLDHTISKPENPQTILDSESKKISEYINGTREPYKLIGVFFSASMVQPHDSVVEFELSIGDYGYIASKDNSNFSSRTAPTRPLCNQSDLDCYCIPWMQQKPCIQVDSVWEDCSHRIQALNILLQLSADLEKNVSEIKDQLIHHCKQEDITDNLLHHIATLDMDLDQGLPKPSHPNKNLLEKKMRDMRESEFKSMKEGLQDMTKQLCNKHNRKEEQKKIISGAIAKLEEYLFRLKYLCIEPQNSVPDVIIWMLHDNERVAFKRIPSHEIMFASLAKARGKNCGKLQTISLQAPPTLNNANSPTSDRRIGAELSVILWLGMDEDYKLQEPGFFTGGNMTPLVEMYECHTLKSLKLLPGKTKKWIDTRRGVHVSKDELLAPHGWKWPDNSSWTLMPLITDYHEEGINEVTERVYEYSSIAAPGEEKSIDTFWCNEHGVKLHLPDEEKTFDLYRHYGCPPGWKWKDQSNWSSTYNHEGWMYATEFSSKSWSLVKRTHHTIKRRQLVRVRKRIGKSVKSTECWEYAATSESHKFSSTEHPLDQFKRRRWIRKVVHHKSSSRVPSKEESAPVQWYLTFNESQCTVFQLRAYLYQARDLYASDRSGLSDPYAIVSFSNHSLCSITVEDTLCPVWNQTIFKRNVKLYGSREFIEGYKEIDCITIQLWDKDQYLKDEYLGVAYGKPLVRLTSDSPQPQLQWLKVIRRGKHAGDILAAFELRIDSDEDEDENVPPISSDGKYMVPKGIAPQVENFMIEFRCWGLRNMKKLRGSKISSPFVELECGGRVIRSDGISNARKNDNFFSRHFITMEMEIPTGRFLPPLNIRVYDKRSFQRLLLVGSHVIKSARMFVDDQKNVRAWPNLTTINMPQSYKSLQFEKPPLYGEEDIMYDWWSKYYFSLNDKKRVQKGYEEAHKDSLVVFKNELEDCFSDGFTDFIKSYSLYRGKGSHDNPDDAVGSIKMAIKLYPLLSPKEGLVLNKFPSNKPVNVLVRVYVVKGFNFKPTDVGESCDPYLVVTIGKRKETTEDNPIKNSINPTFGKVFDIPAIFPYDHTLSVTVMDADRMSRDDLVGTTVIDVENRFYSRHRATCGLPQSVTVYGSNKWHDSADPMKIFYEWVKREGLSNPVWTNGYTHVDIKDNYKTLSYSLEDFEPGNAKHNLPKEICKDHQQRLALYILRKNGVLVPEHVETRTLYHPMHPGVAQGQLHMWVDIFERKQDCRIPPQIDISPRVPEEYELRVIVWNTSDVTLQEVSLPTGEAMSDIYVKGYLQDSTNYHQKTDVHYRSLDGNGSFNWRFIFPLHYIMAENTIVIKQKEHFFKLDETDLHRDPIFTLEVWDNDTFSFNDFIGTAEFNLSEMPYTQKQLKSLTQPQQIYNLFTTKRMKGWWPVHSYKKDGTKVENGNVELEFEILTRDEAQLKPAGKGRDEPNMNPHLLPPKRPESSFFWLTSPLKAFKFIIWKHYKWTIIGIIILVFIIVFLIAIIYTLPSQIIQVSADKLLP